FDGFDGLAGLPQPFSQYLNLNSNQFTYLWVVFSGLVMVICWFIAQRMLNSPWGGPCGPSGRTRTPPTPSARTPCGCA
ncbi:hypothetical protein B1B_06919, partial [mine drainage metagenome]